MNEPNSKLRKTIKLLWHVVLFLSPLLPILIFSSLPQQVTSIPQWEILAAIIALLPAWIMLSLQTLYSQSEKFYFWANRTWLWLTNTTVNWTMSISYDAGADTQKLSHIYSEILKAYENASPWKNEPLQKIINLPHPLGGVIRLRMFSPGSEVDSGDSLLFQLSDLSVPFRQSERALDQIAWIVENVIQKTLGSSQGKFTFKVSFGEHNPYFGLFVKRLRIPDQELLAFKCEFVERQGKAEATVDVSEKRLALTTHNSFDFRYLSSRYVSLASFDFSNF